MSTPLGAKYAATERLKVVKISREVFCQNEPFRKTLGADFALGKRGYPQLSGDGEHFGDLGREGVAAVNAGR
jgi:hypothetical protein